MRVLANDKSSAIIQAQSITGKCGSFRAKVDRFWRLIRRRRRFFAGQRFTQRLSVGKLNVVPVGVGNDAQITGVWIQIGRPKLQHATIFCFRRQRVYIRARVKSKSQVAQRAERQLRLCSRYRLRFAFLQHHDEAESALFVAFAQPNDFHTRTRSVGMSICHAQICVALIKFDARLQTLHMQRQMRPLNLHLSLLKHNCNFKWNNSNKHRQSRQCGKPAATPLVGCRGA